MAFSHEVLARREELLRASVPWASALLSALHREDFAPTHIRHVRGPVWFIRVAPPRAIQEGFGLAPEVLVVAIRGELQARDVEEMHAEVVRSGLRLDGNLGIVADEGSTSLAERIERIGGHGQRIAWDRTADGAWPPLTQILQNVLPTVDVFEERDAVRGSQLVGRETEVSTLRTRVVRGDAVGLFGLRKIGKTSVMRAVTDWFDPASGLREASNDIEEPTAGIAVVVDASLLIDRTVDAVADELLAALRRRMRVARQEMPPLHETGLRGWKTTGEALLDQGHKLCVVIDEYDLLFEGEGGEPAIPGVGRLFRLLRGWAQTRQGLVSLVLVGRDPTYLTAPEIDGVTSPLLAWCTSMWLGPLSSQKATELLRKLGRRVGLAVGRESAELALQWTGGHPLLQRQFGSALRSATRDHDVSWGAATDPFIPPALVRFQEKDAVLAVMREVVALLRDRYPEALSLLVHHARVAHGREHVPPVVTSDDAARVLRNFGLVDTSGAPPRAITHYLNTLAPSPDLREAG